MKISTTAFDFNYHNSQQAGYDHNPYILHNIDVFNHIKIDDKIELLAVYQCGMTYDHNDYNCPSPKLALSDDGGTSDVLLRINELFASDFDDDDIINDALNDVKALCPLIDSVEKLRSLYDAINDNEPTLSDFLDPDEYTNDINDYIENRESGMLTLASEQLAAGIPAP